MIADRWGVTPDELATRYPCDEYVVAPTLEAWRAVTIHAPVSLSRAWLIQVRAAPYSWMRA